MNSGLKNLAKVALVGTVLLVLSAPAGAQEDQVKFAVLMATYEIEEDFDGRACWVHSRVRAQEFGTSGVTKISIEWQVRGPWDQNNIPWVRETGLAKKAHVRIETNEEPDDFRDMVFEWWIPSVLNDESFRLKIDAGTRTGLWVKVTGHRPGITKRDFVVRYELGEVYCDPQPWHGT